MDRTTYDCETGHVTSKKLQSQTMTNAFAMSEGRESWQMEEDLAEPSHAALMDGGFHARCGAGSIAARPTKEGREPASFPTEEAPATRTPLWNKSNTQNRELKNSRILCTSCYGHDCMPHIVVTPTLPPPPPTHPAFFELTKSAWNTLQQAQGAA